MLFPPTAKLPNTDFEVPHVFLGDDAFRIHTNMMKPFRQTAASNHHKKLFLITDYAVHVGLIRLLSATIEDVIIVACCLHNMLWGGYLSFQGKASYEYDPLQEAPAANLINLRRVLVALQTMTAMRCWKYLQTISRWRLVSFSGQGAEMIAGPASVASVASG
ncbi:hypothetical protein PR048_026607 [Dryococelus australis]|uniref:DDE Tnp4 domain-containing protein n=1 Tax=Dryococelus australis TaxID=614101 RepID=A0ABQ9GLT9_9NEOP|nr:hypothetical protein PR048_026607 [Dryococelus australis]